MSGRLHPQFRFDSYVVGAANRLAATAARAVAGSPGSTYNPLFVYAAPGLGKTHLLHSIPALPHPQEGLLHHVLGFAAIPDDQAEGAEQTGVLCVDEVLEVDRGGSGGLLGGPHELRVGREAKWLVHPAT